MLFAHFAALVLFIAGPRAGWNVLGLPSPLQLHIRHIVVVMQENRSFDHYFGTFPGANGFPTSGGRFTVCVQNPSTNACVYPYHNTADKNGGAPHNHHAFLVDYDNGKMDGFIAEAIAGGSKVPNTMMGYHDYHEIPNYWSYAQNYVLQDNMFEPSTGWSFISHLEMVSGWSALCRPANNPTACRTELSSVNKNTSGQYEFPWTDLTWLLHAYGVSWHYYVFTTTTPQTADLDDRDGEYPGLYTAAQTTTDWNPLPSFDDVAADGELSNIVDGSTFFTDAANGTLPAVSWVVPSYNYSEHPAHSVSAGQAYVTSLVNAVMSGPDWNTTAIFIAWDDWGGFYDHVAPPQIDAQGYSIRVPGLVVSPWAKHGYIDHQLLSFDAYTKLIEDDFLGGARLDPSTDGRPDSRPSVRESYSVLGDLTNDFDFTQTPLRPRLLPVRFPLSRM